MTQKVKVYFIDLKVMGMGNDNIWHFWPFWFQSRRFLKVFPMLVYVKHVGPWAGPFLNQGLQFEQSW